MAITKEHVTKEIEALDEWQLKEIADFIAFIKFRARYPDIPVDEKRWQALYEEFAEDDRQLSEEGMIEYANILTKEDTL